MASSRFLSILCSTANATLFSLSIFKTDNNLKNVMASYHLHSISIFLHYQIRFSAAHARVLAFEYKSAFSVLHVHMLIFFKNLYTIKLLEDLPVSVCVCTVKCLNLQRNASTYGVSSDLDGCQGALKREVFFYTFLCVLVRICNQTSSNQHLLVAGC